LVPKCLDFREHPAARAATENRLLLLTKPDNSTVDFKYDPFGRRIKRGTDVFVYDGDNVIGDYSITSGAVVLKGTNIFGPGVDEVLQSHTMNTFTDALGSVRLLQDTAFNWHEGRFAYDDWGKVTPYSSAYAYDLLSGDHRFTGRDDDQTGLIYYRARYYDPTIGRFISEDPIGFRAGVNFYAYALNNPTTFKDPSGLTTLTYQVSSGTLVVDPERQGVVPYAIGASSGRGACVNNLSCLAKPFEGPISLGIYDLKTKELDNPGHIHDLGRTIFKGDWGDWRASLHPRIPLNGIHPKRNNFFLHGGRWSGSAGCIDIGGDVFGNSDTDRVLNDILGDPDGNVEVLVIP
jgi:RHS repeat-associated protein